MRNNCKINMIKSLGGKYIHYKSRISRSEYTLYNYINKYRRTITEYVCACSGL